MALADGAGLPLAVTVASANPSEVSLVGDTLKHRFLRRLPTRIIGDRGYDSDALDNQLAKRGVEFIAPHRSTRYERHVENFLAFVQLACIIILSRRFVG
jgi:hypothetical protein